MTDTLQDFTHAPFTYDGKSRDVYRRGTGPGVVIMHEVPGITPRVADFGRRVAEAGMTAVLPVALRHAGQAALDAGDRPNDGRRVRLA